jgi:hypothetical protein
MHRFVKYTTTLLIIALFVMGGLRLSQSRHSATGVAAQPMSVSVAPLRALNFEPNVGQTDPQVKFLARGQGYSLFLTRDGAVLSLRKPSTTKSHSQLNAGDSPLLAKKDSAAPAVLRMRLVGANSAPQIAGRNPLPGKNNYFIGNDPSKWHSNVATYSKVGYDNIYPGIDLVYYGNRGQLEHDFIVKPGANPNSITLGFEGADQLKLDSQGNLLVRADGDEVSFHAPVVYQQSHGKKLTIEGRYVVKNQKQVGFEVAAYNAQEPLVIDPVLVYATYIGGSGDDFGTGIAVDTAGNAYVVGQTVSANFPTSATAFQKVLKSSVDNVFVSKVNTTGSALVYSTYIGGTGTDEGIGIAVDAAGSAYITGDTSSSNFPTTANAFQKTIGDAAGDSFVTKLSADGSSLVYSSFLGGDAFDIGYDIAVDSAGNAYVAGQTFSGNFPLAGTPAQPVYGGKSEACITKVNPAGTALVYSTYWGGSNGDEQARAIVVDSTGNAYIAGQTTSTNFPTTPSPIQAAYGGGTFDAIVAKLNPTGSAMLYSTYLGGNDLDQGRGIAIDSAGNAYVTGQTSSTNFPIAGNPFQKTYGGGLADGFVFKVNPTGSALVFSGYFGGNTEDQGDHGMAVDSSGNIYIAGFTNSPNFPITANPIQGTYQGGAYDAILMKLTTDGSSQIYSTYFGGNFTDSGRAIAVDSAGNAYAVLYTNSTTIPTTTGAFQTVNGGGFDAFVLKVSESSAVATLSPSSLTFASQVVGTTSGAQAVTLSNTGNLAMAITGITITGTNAADFAQTNTCGASVAVAANCAISVIFKPTAAGTRIATVSVADSASGSPQTFTLTGTAQAAGAVATLSATSVSFGNQLLNTNSAPRTVLLTNTGASTLTITGVTITGTNGTNYTQTNTCNGSVAANASCTFTLIFRPTATGTRTGTLNIADNSVPSPQTVALTGVGSTTAAAVASLAPASLTFTNQYVNSTSAAQIITLTNTGNESLGITSILVTGANSTDFAQTNNCGTTILAAGNCTINVTFTPTAAGARAAAVTFTDNAANSPQSIALTGTGVASPTGPFNHVFIVVESGRDYSNVVGAVDMPYFTGLINQYGLATTYYADAHPGISDYFMLTTGQTVTTDNNLPNTNVDNIVRELVATGKTWKVYAEDLPSVGYMGGDVNLYLKHHNPFVYLTDVQNSPAQQLNVVPFTQFASDLANNALPQYVFIVPNDFNDSEVGSRADTDTWLQTNINPLIQSAFFQNKGLLVITFDQAATDNTNGGGQVATVIVGPTVKPGYKSTTLYEHASVLRLMASGLGVPVLPGAAATAADMSEFFAAAPAVGLAPASLTFASQLTNTTSAPQSITLTNTGNAPLTIASIAASAQYGQTNSCPTSPSTLPANGTCTINVTFTPTAAGAQPGTITFTDNVNGSPQIFNLTGTGVVPAPVVTLAPASLTFASQTVNTTSAPQSVTLTNTGTAVLTITSIAASAQYAQTNTCPVSPATIGIAGTCSISVTFTPTAVGVQAGSITIVDNAAGSPRAITLSGTGAAAPAPVVTLSATTVTFGSQQINVASGTKSVTLTNTGNAPLNITGFTVTGTNSADYTQTNTCGASVLAAANCTISITFKPTATGTRTASLSIADNAVNTPQAITLSGTGSSTATSQVTLSPTSLIFTGQAVGTQSAAQTVTVTNTGTVTATLISGTFIGTNASDFSFTTNCPTSLAVGASCTASLRFTPGAAGTRTATFQANDNASNSPQTVSLRGTNAAAAPAVTLTPASLTFASQALNTTSVAQGVTLTNSGFAALTITSIAASAQYAQTNNCPVSPATLAANGTCTISVTFTPTANGVQAGSVTITDNATGSPHAIVLSGTGSGTAPVVSLSPASLTFASQTINTPSASQSVTLTNTGSGALTITSIAASAQYGQTNTCPVSPATLAAAGTCTISVTFTPTATGLQTGSISIVDNAAGNPHAISLSGTGASAPAPVVSLAPASLAFASQTINTTSGSQGVTLTNTGNAALTITSIAASAQYGQTNTCPVSPATLAAAGTCTISVTFTPTATGTQTGSITIVDDAAGSPHAITLSGTGAGVPAPVVSLAPASLTFASQPTSTTSAPQSVTLTNTGNAALTITSIAASAQYGQTNTCPVSPATLAAAGTCSISVTFTPTATGIQTGSITIVDDAAGSPHAITLSGTGSTPAPVVSLAPASLTFASQTINTTSAPQSVTLTNTGNAALTITSIAASAQYGQTNTCPVSPATLAAAGTCSISVTFTPTATGTQTGSITIVDNAAGSPHAISLTGTGTAVAAPVVSLSPTSLTYASQAVNTTSASKPVTLTNTGNAALTITSIAASAQYGQTNNCPVSPATLAAAATCTINVTFTPTAAGTQAGSITITDNAAGSPHAVTLSGTGAAAAPVVGLNPTSLAFGTQQINVASAVRTVTLTNTGNATLTITGFTVTGTNSAEFTQTNTCGASVLAAGTCTISVTFKPTATGARTASISIADNAANSPQAIALTGTGSNTATPQVTFSPTSFTFAAQAVGTQSAAQTLTVTNSGTVTLTLVSGSFTGTNASDFSFTTNCPTSLAVGATCTASLRFRPGAVGARTATFLATDNASGSPQSIPLTGTGQ